MNASLIKFAVAVLASVIITGCGGGTSANNSAQQDSPVLSEELPVAATVVKQIDFSSFADQNLVDCIKENKIAHTAVQVLICTDKGIKSLDGIEQLSNLRVVDLSKNQIQNIQPLAKLSKLSSLVVSFNKLTSLNGLEHLSMLDRLNASNNQLADAEVLQDLKNLKQLYISNNQLQSLAFISSLQSLENLDAENNRRTSLPSLPSGIKTFSI